MGLLSPFLKSPKGLSTPDGELHKVKPELYAEIKQEHWGWVGVLKYHVQTLHEASNANMFVLEVEGDTQNFRINLRRTAVWPISKKDQHHSIIILSLSFGEYVPVDVLFDIKTSDTVVARTSSSDVRQALDKAMLRCAAKMLTTENSLKTMARKYAMSKILIDLRLLD